MPQSTLQRSSGRAKHVGFAALLAALSGRFLVPPTGMLAAEIEPALKRALERIEQHGGGLWLVAVEGERDGREWRAAVPGFAPQGANGFRPPSPQGWRRGCRRANRFYWRRATHAASALTPSAAEDWLRCGVESVDLLPLRAGGKVLGGKFALTPVGGSAGLADATRYFSVIPPGTYVANGAGSGGFGNALQDGSKTGIANLTVNLYVDANTNGVVDAGDPFVASTVTDAPGHYIFTNLADARFLVAVSLTDPDLDEPELASVWVTTTITYANGTVVRQATQTDANGAYQFANLLLDENYHGTSPRSPTLCSRCRRRPASSPHSSASAIPRWIPMTRRAPPPLSARAV